MKYCSKCGNELLDDAVMCPTCGALCKKTNAAQKNSSPNGYSKAISALLTVDVVIDCIVLALAVFLVVFYLVAGLYDILFIVIILLIIGIAIVILGFVRLNAYKRKVNDNSFVGGGFIAFIVISGIFCSGLSGWLLLIIEGILLYLDKGVKGENLD